VERGTLNKAAKLAKFYFKESQSLYAGCGDELAPQLVKILNFAQRRGAEITAREVKQSDRSFGKPDEIRSMFTQLVSMGYGSVVGSGCRLKYNFSEKIPTVDNCRQTVDKTVDSETTMNNGLQPIVDIVDKKQKKLERTNKLDTVPWDDPQDGVSKPTVDKPEKTVDVENLSTMSTVPQNCDTVTVPLSTETSTVCLQDVYSFEKGVTVNKVVKNPTQEPTSITDIESDLLIAIGIIIDELKSDDLSVEDKIESINSIRDTEAQRATLRALTPKIKALYPDDYQILVDFLKDYPYQQIS
jgi:hypothetical protein